MNKEKKRYDLEELPINENLEKFAPSFTPETYTEEEVWLMKPFVTNLDKPVYIVHHLPEEVIGAISAKESRSKTGLRRVLLNDYLLPTVHPETTKEWATATLEQKEKALETKDKLLEIIDFENTHGGIEGVVNIQRGRKFFDVWYYEYGDESIAEGAGIHLFMEGVSNIAAKEIEDKRIGISPIEKSSRYVSFADKKPDGTYLYVVPGEIKGTELEAEYKKVMDYLFDTYSLLLVPYLEYIKSEFPKGEDESESSFNKSRGAKRFDDLRDLLPFATQTDLGLYGNTRAFEDTINRLIGNPLGELRYWGQQMFNELDQVVPSLVKRAKTEKGAVIQNYRRNIKTLRSEMVDELLTEEFTDREGKWSRLISSTPEADIVILMTYLFEGTDHSLLQVKNALIEAGPQKRSELLANILKERASGKDKADRYVDRFKKVPRAFENAHYLYDVWARGGDYRDLQRHRMLTQGRKRFTTKGGIDLEKEVYQFPGLVKIIKAFEVSEELFKKMHAVSPDVGQYAVLFGFVQHWYMNITARGLHWMGELRTGPQARPHYKEVVLSLVDQAIARDPSVYQGIMVDRQDTRLSRRESEKNIERKILGQ